MELSIVISDPYDSLSEFEALRYESVEFLS